MRPSAQARPQAEAAKGLSAGRGRRQQAPPTPDGYRRGHPLRRPTAPEPKGGNRGNPAGATHGGNPAPPCEIRGEERRASPKGSGGGKSGTRTGGIERRPDAAGRDLGRIWGGFWGGFGRDLGRFGVDLGAVLGGSWVGVRVRYSNAVAGYLGWWVGLGGIWGGVPDIVTR